MHKKGNIGVFQMKKLQHIRLREGSKADQFLSGQLTSKYFSYQEIFAMLMPLIFDQFFISVIALLTTAMISFIQPGIGVGCQSGIATLHDDLCGLQCDFFRGNSDYRTV